MDVFVAQRPCAPSLGQAINGSIGGIPQAAR
jgi:hypothetical protein